MCIRDRFKAVVERLERHYRDMQDIEFTVERGALYMLQTRSGKRTAKAALKAVSYTHLLIKGHPKDEAEMKKILSDDPYPPGFK